MIIFDGGSRGNPGPGYGSYILRTRDGREDRRRLAFGPLTNNEAEYRTPIAAPDDLIARIRKAGRDPSRFTIEIRGDGRPVPARPQEEYLVRTSHLCPLYEAVRERLGRFREARLVWQPRGVSVAEPGH